MNDLLQTHALLAAGLRADPLFSLASVVCWLDPLWGDEEEEWDLPQDEDGTLAVALRVTRQAFPDVYAQAVEAVRYGASYTELDRLICGAITARGIPLDDLEWIGFGIPMPAYGVALDDPDFYAVHPDTISVLQCFGITPEPNPYHVDVPDCAYTAGKLIAADLQGQADTRWRQVAWLLGWLFACTGNSSVDYSDEEQSEFQPLSWEADDLTFAVEIIQEAETILADALAGLAFINGQPDLLAALQHNVQRIYKAFEKTKGKPREPHIRLAWPHVAGGTE